MCHLEENSGALETSGRSHKDDNIYILGIYTMTVALQKENNKSHFYFIMNDKSDILYLYRQ